VSWSRVRPPVRRQLPRNRACTLRYFPLLLWMWYAIIWSKLEACRFKSCGRIEVLHAACPAVRRQRSCCLVARAMCRPWPLVIRRAHHSDWELVFRVAPGHPRRNLLEIAHNRLELRPLPCARISDSRGGRGPAGRPFLHNRRSHEGIGESREGSNTKRRAKRMCSKLKS